MYRIERADVVPVTVHLTNEPGSHHAGINKYAIALETGITRILSQEHHWCLLVVSFNVVESQGQFQSVIWSKYQLTGEVVTSACTELCTVALTDIVLNAVNHLVTT